MLGNFNILCHFAMTDRHRVHVKMAKTSKIIAWSRIIDKIEQSYLDRTVFALGASPSVEIFFSHFQPLASSPLNGEW